MEKGSKLLKIQEGARLKSLRKERGWTQSELADKLNVTKSHVSQWENGKTTPREKVACEINKLFSTRVYNLCLPEVSYKASTFLNIAVNGSSKMPLSELLKSIDVLSLSDTEEELIQAYYRGNWVIKEY